MSFHCMEKKGVCSLFCLFKIVELAATQVCCFSSVNIKVGGSEVPIQITAATVVSNTVGEFHCHADRSCFTRDHLFGSLKLHLGRSSFCCNEEVEMAICEWVLEQEPNFYDYGIF